MLATEGIPVLRWGFFIVVGLAAIVAAFVVTYVLVATVVLSVLRLVRGRTGPDSD